MSFAAVILAAGRSSRMGEFKPLLPLGDSTFAGQLIRLYRSAGISDLLVVTGRESDNLKAALAENTISFRHNPDYAVTDMLTSMKIGLAGILEISEADAVFVGPVDIPLITPYTVSTLLDAAAADPDAHVILPEYQGKTGHPVLIRRSEISSLLKWNGDGGLKAYLSENAGHVLTVPVPDPAIRMDADDHEAYDRLCGYLARREIPDEARCAELWDFFGVPDKVRQHMRAVADEARGMEEKLAEKGYVLNKNKIAAASLLHDLARVHPDHPNKAADWLRALGHTGIEECVRVHMALPERYAHICEELIVFLADKYRRGTERIPIRERYEEKIRKFTDLSARESAKAKLTEALAFEAIYLEAVK